MHLLWYIDDNLASYLSPLQAIFLNVSYIVNFKDKELLTTESAQAQSRTAKKNCEIYGI